MLHMVISLGSLTNVSPHEYFFLNYKKGDYGTVEMGNDVTNKIVGIGDIVLLIDT